jgi:hypothetical protein
VSRFLDKFGSDFFPFSGRPEYDLKFLEFLNLWEITDAVVGSIPDVKHVNVVRDSESCANSGRESVPVKHLDCLVSRSTIQLQHYPKTHPRIHSERSGQA